MLATRYMMFYPKHLHIPERPVCYERIKAAVDGMQHVDIHEFYTKVAASYVDHCNIPRCPLVPNPDNINNPIERDEMVRLSMLASFHYRFKNWQQFDEFARMEVSAQRYTSVINMNFRSCPETKDYLLARVTQKTKIPANQAADYVLSQIQLSCKHCCTHHTCRFTPGHCVIRDSVPKETAGCESHNSKTPDQRSLQILGEEIAATVYMKTRPLCITHMAEQ